ncbi:MAG TPA: multi antimicrobial extrusion protein MatE [Bacilli bacterium]
MRDSLAQSKQKPPLLRIFAFFLPLGASATLVTASHVIINSTLARSEHPETIISSYAIALSLFSILDRSTGLLRQSCSALVRDRVSFQAMSHIANLLILSTILFSLLVSYTPLGVGIFRYLFGEQESLLQPTIHVFRILMFVSVFSGLRCLYHGIIITNFHTKWLTIGMVFRLGVMYAISLGFILKWGVHDGRVGAVIFMAGMMVEATVAVWEGKTLLRKMPRKLPGHNVEKPKQVFAFFRPMLYSSFIAVVIGPSINAMLGKTADVPLSIASYAVALNVTQLMTSFFTYIHQIALNFYKREAHAVKTFMLIVCLIPTALNFMLVHTPAGPWFLHHIMGLQHELLTATLEAIGVFMLMTLVVPWLDFANGLVMLRGQTKIMVWSQSANAALTVLVLLLCVWLAPGLNGNIGALAQSLGMLAELSFVTYALRRGRANALIWQMKQDHNRAMPK